MITLPLLVAAAVYSPRTPADQKGPVWLVFFIRGDGARPKQPAALEKMQKEHIANLDRLFGARKLLAAGPVEDPTQRRRGIAVMTVPNQNAIIDCFKTDPYIRGHIMNLEAFRWNIDRKSIRTDGLDKHKMEEDRLIQLTFTHRPSDAQLARHWAVYRSLHLARASGGTEVDPFIGGVYSEFFLQKGANATKLVAALRSDDLFRTAVPKLEVMPLHLVKDALRD